MPQIRLPQLSLPRNIPVRTGTQRKCQVPTFLCSSPTPSLNGALWARKGMWHTMQSKKWRHYLEDAEILLKSDAKSLEKFLWGRTDDVKLDRWALELQGRNVHIEHIPGHKNKAADCLSQLPFMTRKRNDNPLKDEDVSVHETKVEIGEDCCPLCEVDLTDTKALQQSDKHCIRIAKMLEDPRSRFHEKDSYEYDDTGLLYHINRENGKEYKVMVVPKTLITTILQEMHEHFGHFRIGKLIPWSRDITTGPKW